MIAAETTFLVVAKDAIPTRRFRRHREMTGAETMARPSRNGTRVRDERRGAAIFGRKLHNRGGPSIANASGMRAIRFPGREISCGGDAIARRETNPFDPPDYPVDGARRRRAFNLQISSGLQIDALRLSLSLAPSRFLFRHSLLRCRDGATRD